MILLLCLSRSSIFIIIVTLFMCLFIKIHKKITISGFISLLLLRRIYMMYINCGVSSVSQLMAARFICIFFTFYSSADVIWRRDLCFFFIVVCDSTVCCCSTPPTKADEFELVPPLLRELGQDLRRHD